MFKFLFESIKRYLVIPHAFEILDSLSFSVLKIKIGTLCVSQHMPPSQLYPELEGDLDPTSHDWQIN